MFWNEEIETMPRKELEELQLKKLQKTVKRAFDKIPYYNKKYSEAEVYPEDIVFTTIENAVYMGMKNDISLLLADTMSLYEQQSTYNPNMPMRFLIYAGMLYDNYIETHSEYRRYSSVQQKAPTPKCVCFYNGTTQMNDIVTLRLSDSFSSASESDIEVKVTMININYGHNSELLEGCRPLRDYSYFVHETRANQKALGSLEKAVDAAIEKMADDSLIKSFLIANRSEVKSMFITEYDEERAFAEQREDAREEGIAEGMEKGMAKGIAEGMEKGMEKGRMEGTLLTLFGLVKDGLLTLAQAAERAHMPEAEFKLQMEQM